MGGVTPAYSENIILKFSTRLSFQCLSSLLGVENVVKCFQFIRGRFVRTLPKYLQLALTIDAIINFGMQNNKSLYNWEDVLLNANV